MRHAQATVSIDAPAELVWTVMLDLDSYGSWNPVIVRVDTPGGRAARVGDANTLHVRFRGGRAVASRERITTISPPAASGDVVLALLEYEFYGRLHGVGLVRGRRSQLLEQGPDGSTVYRTSEGFRGGLAFLVPVRSVRDGFLRHALALKQRAEFLAGVGGFGAGWPTLGGQA
jgi:hypothetical protein